jgi:glycine cleavage system protein P-like pyridoxal-binding family
VPQRVDEGNRLLNRHHCDNARLIQQDLSNKAQTLPLGDCYFIYDYGTLEHIRWTMAQLQNLSEIHRFQVMARGQGIRSLIDMAHPWLHKNVDNPHREYFEVYNTHLT